MPNDPQIHYTRPEYRPGDVRRYDPPAYLPQPMTSQVVALAVYSARISANTQGRNPWSIYWSDAMAIIVPTVLTWPRPEESMAKLRDLFRSVHQAAVSELMAVMWPRSEARAIPMGVTPYDSGKDPHHAYAAGPTYGQFLDGNPCAVCARPEVDHATPVDAKAEWLQKTQGQF